MASDTNHQCHYVGDGDGDGALPGAEMLFKQGLHSVKGLFDSQVYLKNPKSAEADASREQPEIIRKHHWCCQWSAI